MAAARGRAWVLLALAGVAAVAAIDVLTGDAAFARSVYLLPVLLFALRAKPLEAAIVAVVAIALAAVSPLWNETPATALPLVTVIVGSAIAVWGARLRDSALQARAAADAERRQLRLLAEAARITDGAADIDEALRRLVDLLVPDLADAAWIDLLPPGGGGVRRLAARVDGPDGEELEAWLLARGSTGRTDISPMTRALRGEGSQLTELDERMQVSLSQDEDDEELMRRSGFRWTMALPLAPSGGPLGALALAVGRSGRRYGPDELAFAELLVGRAGLALANAQLVRRMGATQRRLDGILGALTEAVTVHDAEGRIEYANAAAAKLLYLPGVHALLTAEAGELAARFDTRDPAGRPVRFEDFPGPRVIRGETPEPMLTQSIYRATGELRWYLTKATPLPDESGAILAVNVIEDVTEQHEASLRQQFLADAGEMLSSSLGYEETLQRVARLAVPRLADWCSVELPDDRGTLQQVALAHVDPEMVEHARGMRERYPPDPDAPRGSSAVMRTGEPMLLPEIPDELLVEAAQDEEHLAAIRALRIRSGMSVPMITAGEVLGVITFVFSDSGRVYDEDDLVFAQALAGRAAGAIENARLYTERSEASRTLQDSLLPEGLPEAPGWELAASYRPGERGAEVGGDFYDVFPVEGAYMALLGDVTGKGVAAAALTSLVRHTAKTAALFDPRPAAVLTVVNRALRQRPRIAPVTMLCGLLREGELTLAVGGHPLPLLKRAGRPCERVGRPGLLLGAVDDYPAAEEETVPLDRGDVLLLFTDGVTDTPGANGRFGERRLRAAADAAPADPERLLDAIAQAVDEFAAGGGLDDRALLAVRRA